MPFRDYFSDHADLYAHTRPSYPAALFDYLAGLALGHDLAWDCATGNGQAAVALAERFQRVIATDASQAQIEEAMPHERVDYRAEPAEATSIPAESVDLVTVATAVHWFDFERFYVEVQRVAKPGGVIAVWTYRLPSVRPDIDPILNTYGNETLDGYWPPRIRFINERYRTIPFPFKEIRPPKFTIETTWDLPHLIGFLRSWSGTSRYIDKTGQNPLSPLVPQLESAWGDPEMKRTVSWQLFMRVGRVTR